MTRSKRSRVVRLVELLGAAAVIAALVALDKRGPPTVQAKLHCPSKPPRSPWPEIITYAVGYGIALLLTAAAFALVHWHWASPSTALWTVFALALAQIVVHFRCFLHVTLRASARDDLSLILFSSVIIFLMMGGTLVILFNLRMRMM